MWSFLVSQSIEAQRTIRVWKEQDEGRILFFLQNTLRSWNLETGGWGWGDSGDSWGQQAQGKTLERSSVGSPGGFVLGRNGVQQ